MEEGIKTRCSMAIIDVNYILTIPSDIHKNTIVV